MGFFSRLFGGGAKSEGEPVRRLSHPRDLRQGDIVKFSYLDQPDVSGKQFEVSEVNTYVYDGINYPELVLKDSANNIIFLMIEEEDGEECVAISKKVGRSQIRKIIGQEDLDKVMQKGTGTIVNVASTPEGFEGWLAKTYTETDDNVKGSYSRGDARSSATGGRESFTSHTLIDDDDEFALELEIYGANEIELSATAYLDMSDIEEMWPGNQSV